MRLSAKLAVTAATAAVLVGSGAGTAFAYDCFNASRSAQGDTSAAANSGVWWSIPEFLSAEVGLSDADIAQVMAVVDSDPRIPANFTVYYNPAHPSELASKMRADLATNGRGIDHSDDYPTPVFQALMEDAFIALS